VQSSIALTSPIKIPSITASLSSLDHPVNYRKIRALDNFKDNKAELISIGKDMSCLLEGNFKDMDILHKLFNSRN
jgi:hypothetical protein